MTDPSELIARLSVYEGLGQLPSLGIHPDMGGCSTGILYGVARDAVDMLRTLAAERDAALAKVENLSRQIGTMAIDALIDQNQAMGAYEKPAAPPVETVRVRIPVLMWADGSMRIDWSRFSSGQQVASGNQRNIGATITADIPILQPTEVASTVGVTHEG